MQLLSCFKAYDIRGRLGDELNEDIAYRIGRAYGEVLRPKTVVVGGDIRLTSEALKLAVTNGLADAGADVLDLGMTGTEEVYFATFHLGMDGGIEVTASHNPIDYNGMKLVREGSRPISGDSGLKNIQRLAESQAWGEVVKRGSIKPIRLKAEYARHMVSYINPGRLRPLKLVVNAGNGAAGPALDAIARELSSLGVAFEFIRVHHQPDGHFPHGIPNPLLPENRVVTRDAVLAHGADMGIAWDGDFDRCFLFDEQGNFIEGYYIVGLLAEAFLQNQPGGRIIHDPRLIWNTIDVVTRAGGVPVQSKTGHAFIKERMRLEDAVYGGEMSAHHYFRDFAYCDSGMIPWLLVAELMCVSGKALSQLLAERMAAYPSSGEINSKLPDAKATIARVQEAYQPHVLSVDTTDGISLDMGDWRFNLRSSNTEPVVRLNVESRHDVELMQQKTKELLLLLRGS
ncbi:phosphohexomutase domain-containing protein [Zobellella maritima]|uniref:phosphomannomutase CpsG n=1 Tax=Zobellella maritima TaxID=2059725 RepID=UPI000E302134|nr:phosphomannomutase CpsG [Zobellella maritima]